MNLDTFTFKKEKCPFCYGGGGTDDRDNTFRKKCDHTFTMLEYNGLLTAISDMEKTLKQNKNIARQMRTIIRKRVGR